MQTPHDAYQSAYVAAIAAEAAADAADAAYAAYARKVFWRNAADKLLELLAEA